MKILIFNWRDIKNPSSGGAEILTHEIARTWVQKGHQVTLFSSFFKGARKQEKIEGVTIIRKGRADARYLFASVQWYAFLQYRKEFKGKVDIVIDEIHGIPFFTSWYVTEKKLVLICEVAGDLWIKMFGPIFGNIGKTIERFYLKYTYRNINFLTISQSVKDDLIKYGVNGKNITLLKMGINKPHKISMTKKEKRPTIIFLGRLSPSKGVEDALFAFKLIFSAYPNAQMWIIGKGEEEYTHQMKAYAKKLKIYEEITFFGYVSEDQKYNLLSKGWILVHSSQTEGWGINVIEANTVGIPAVGYNVSGLRDSIQDGKTGILTGVNTPEGLADGVIRLMLDERLYKTLAVNAKEWSKNFSWDEAGSKSLSVLEDLYEK